MSEPAKPRRWWKRGVLGVLALIVVAGGVVWWMRTASQRELADAFAELDRDDPGWRLDDILASRRKLRDEDNSALVALAATPKLRVAALEDAPNYEQVMTPWRPPAALSHLQREFLRTELAKGAAGLALLRRLKDMPEGSFPLKIAPDAVSTLVPHIQELISHVNWLRHDAMLRASDESVDAALESCQAQLNAIWAHADQGFPIAMLQRSGRFQITLRTVEFCLSQGEASPEALAALQALASREIGDREFHQMMRGDRAGTVQYLLNYDKTTYSLHAMKANLNANFKKAAPTWLDKRFDYFPQSASSELPGYLRYMNRVVEAAKLPLHEQLDVLKKLDSELGNESAVTQTLAHPSALLYRPACRGQAAVRTMVVALACERYRVQHKAWPASLESLVEAKLHDAVPLDPCDGKPLRYRRTEWGVVVYSVSNDRVDNDGAIDHDQPHVEGADLGIRLWDVPRRKGGMP